MMKSISIFVALLTFFFAGMALAAGAVATSVTGSVSVQTGTATVRPLRQGDSVVQGDTVVTGAASSAVLRFDDGEITALTSNSRLQVTAYQYNPTNNSGNVFLSQYKVQIDEGSRCQALVGEPAQDWPLEGNQG